MTKLPINLEALLRQRTVEGERIEYKAGWNPDAVVRTLCAFANNFANLGGGYIVIGQDCDEDGQPVFPPAGLPKSQLDKIQRELLRYCNLIQPPYFPVLSVEVFDGRNLIVLQAPGGQNRPYKSPAAVTAKTKVFHYFIRRYRNRRIGEFLKELDLTEGRATGIPKILRVMAANGSPVPEFDSDDDRTSFLIRLPVHTAVEQQSGKIGFSAVTGEVTGEVAEREIEGFTGEVTGEVMRLLDVINEEMQRRAIQDALGLTHQDHFRRAYLLPALAAGVIEMTIPDKPQSSRQRYRLTQKGRRLRKSAKLNW